MKPTNEQLKAGLKLALAVAEAVREAGPNGISSGLVYTAVMNKVDGVQSYEALVNMLVNSGVVARKPGHLLLWVGSSDIVVPDKRTCGSCRHIAAASGATDHWCPRVGSSVNAAELFCGGDSYEPRGGVKERKVYGKP